MTLIDNDEGKIWKGKKKTPKVNNFISNEEFVWLNLITGRDGVEKNPSVCLRTNVLGNWSVGGRRGWMLNIFNGLWNLCCGPDVPSSFTFHVMEKIDFLFLQKQSNDIKNFRETLFISYQ